MFSLFNNKCSLQSSFWQNLLPPASEGWRRYCFHRCVSVHIGRGGGYPSPRFFPRSLLPGPFWKGYPSPWFFAKSLVPGPFQGYPSLSWGGGVPQDRGTSPGRTGVGHTPRQDRIGIPPARYPLAGTGASPLHPKTEQQSKHLLRGGRYASCDHAGRLSCYLFILAKLICLQHDLFNKKLI